MEILKENTPQMFDGIAATYDKLNHRLSFSMDKNWRRKFVKILSFRKYETIVDVASGTGDLLVNLQKLNATNYIAVDPSPKMLDIAKFKVADAQFIISGAESMPLADQSADLITVSFGIRNFVSPEEALKEFYRVLKPGGITSIMEFSVPRFFLFRWGFKLYIFTVIPIWGKLLSGDKKAYKYLAQSIVNFAQTTDIPQKLKSAGFTSVKTHSLMLGSVRIYEGRK
jgi:demethylmenaquinone methyltransferase/2-methoxy-6-polyprenyl-1,4-benzoquinol methylase